MLIVQGVFRSGTTTLFRVLRQDARLHCYYEPLHPNLVDHVNEAAATRPAHPKSPLYAEFASLSDWLEEHYTPCLGMKCAVLDRDDDAPALRAYLQRLVDAAPQAVLQLNRGFWMTRWLHHHFPESCFVHLVRNPRSVVWSQLTTRSGNRARVNWPLLGHRYFNISSGDLRKVFSPRAYYGAYQVRAYLEQGRRRLGSAAGDDVMAWAHDRLHAVREARPFVQALALWGAQVRVCHRQAKETFGSRYLLLRYEDLCRAPKRELGRIYRLLQHEAPAPPVLQYGDACIHTNCLDAWRDVDGAKDHFRTGIQQAGIGEVLRELGYACARHRPT